MPNSENDKINTIIGTRNRIHRCDRLKRRRPFFRFTHVILIQIPQVIDNIELVFPLLRTHIYREMSFINSYYLLKYLPKRRAFINVELLLYIYIHPVNIKLIGLKLKDNRFL